MSFAAGTFSGTPFARAIMALGGGNDLAEGGGGDDAISGGAGRDLVDGRAGDDRLAAAGRQTAFISPRPSATTGSPIFPRGRTCSTSATTKAWTASAT